MKELMAHADAVQSWLRELAKVEAVFFPQPTGERSYRFEPVTPKSALDLTRYAPTIVPPNKKLMPAQDELVRFRPGKQGRPEVEAVLDTSHRILAGVRSCDLKGLWLMDKVQRDGVPDPYYLARRDNTAIIGVDCAKPCTDKVFCQATRSLGHKEGADVYLTPVGDEILVESLTARGDGLVAKAKFSAAKDAAGLRKKAEAARPKPFGRQLRTPVAELPALLEKNYKSEVWDEHVKKCFSCGTCTMVCPTCYCFDVRDDLNFDLSSGHRVRTWDSCMLPQFSAVAGGHNFRPDPAARQRHRVKRKFEYLTDRFGGDSFCVGCGRCGRQCTTHIDIFEIVNDLAARGGAQS